MTINSLILRISFCLLFATFCLRGLCAESGIVVSGFGLGGQLPSSSVTRVFQDSEGYVWLGTLDGLCRYDGSKVVTFRSNRGNPGLLSENEIKCIAEDHRNNIWIGTDSGIDILDKHNYTIRHLDNPSIDSLEVYSVTVTRDGRIWAGAGSFTFCFDSDFRLVKRYENQASSTNCIYEDREGRIWITKWDNGLYLYDGATDDFVKYPKVGSSDSAFVLFQDDRGQHWLSTWRDGLFLFHPDSSTDRMYEPVNVRGKEGDAFTKVFFSIAQDGVLGRVWTVSFSGIYAFEYDEEGLLAEVDLGGLMSGFNNIFSEIKTDNRGNLWIASFDEEVIFIDFGASGIATLEMPKIKRMTGLTPNITAIYEAEDGTLWFNQNRWGMGTYNPMDGKIILFNEFGEHYGFSDFSTASDFRSLPGELWFARRHSPVIHSISKDGSSIRRNYTIDLSKIETEPGPVLKFHEDAEDNIWILTARKLFVKPPGGSVRSVSLPLGELTSLAEDRSGNIVVGSMRDGLCSFSASEISPSQIRLNTSGTGGLKSNRITALCTDAGGRVWIGTKEGYVMSCDIENGVFTDVSDSFRAITTGIQDIISDNSGHLWISTNDRVVEYNPANGAIRDYKHSKGLEISSFIANSHAIGRDGRIYYGGNGGMTVFTPSDELDRSATHMPVLVTDVRIDNRSVFDGVRSSGMDFLRRELRFEPGDKNIQIDFSSLDFSNPAKVRYAYKMEGVDDDWVYTDYDRQFAYYNRLPKGRYTFFVKSAGDNGLWSDEAAEFEIYKRPAFYETTWAYIIYVLLGASALCGAYVVIKNRVRLRHELRIAQIERDKSEELAQAKLHYFTNISHDFLTPLTIINCLIEDIEANVTHRYGQLGLIRSNVRKLQRLLKQILDFRRVENGKVKLKVGHGDIVRFVREVCYVHFIPLMDKSNIGFVFETDEESLDAYFDSDIMDKVVFNLLSNACKFTPPGGVITVGIRRKTENVTQCVELTVGDTGIGMSEQDIEKVFNLFYTGSVAGGIESNGIGLSLVRELVEIHHGTVTVSSQRNAGSLFSIIIPAGRDCYDDSEMAEDQKIDTNESAAVRPEEVRQGGESVRETTLLLVEDNEDLLEVMRSILSRMFNVVTATNGRDALARIREVDINLVISDVMMPEMDGIELCRALKADFETSHIPVILLTARNSIEDRIECYNAGADAYIAKPFELKLLTARINNFMNRKRDKQKDFRSGFDINLSVLESPSVDEQFLNRVVSLIEDQVAESEFDVGVLAGNLNMSKSSLYRKLKSLTGLSPSDFIRNIKLKRACIMLRDRSINIAEVSYAVGFSDPKYFSTCFKNEFGLAPSEYQKQSDGRTS